MLDCSIEDGEYFFESPNLESISVSSPNLSNLSNSSSTATKSTRNNSSSVHSLRHSIENEIAFPEFRARYWPRLCGNASNKKAISNKNFNCHDVYKEFLMIKGYFNIYVLNQR